MEVRLLETNLKALQKQALSKKALQSIGILQMNNIDLTNHIHDFYIDNPLVDIENNKAEKDVIKKLEWLNDIDQKNKVYYKANCENCNENENKDSLIYDDSLYLASILLEQLHMLDLPIEDTKICKFIIENLNEDGYLDCKEDIKIMLNIKEVEIQRFIKIIQTFEPTGVCATSLSECLILQLKEKQKVNKVIEDIINYDLKALSKNQFKSIELKYDISKEDIKNLIRNIKTLNPRPCSAFTRNEAIKYITPDIIIIKFEDFFEVVLNDCLVPSICINEQYLNILKSDIDKETKAYIQNKLNQIIKVQECIAARKKTIINTVNVIVKEQISFFKHGPGNLVPLTYSKIANEIKVHESTVCRAIKNKYLQCNYGIFPLKYFFINKIEHENDNIWTPEKIKIQLKKIISSENIKSPLSDQSLTKILNDMGIIIKRRTVSKYRDELHIPTASSRKDI